MIGLLIRATVSRTHFKILSDFQLFLIICDGTRTRYFKKIKGVALGWNQIALIFQHMKLIMIRRARHTDSLADRRRRYCQNVIVGIGCKIQIQQQGMGRKITSRSHPVLVFDP